MHSPDNISIVETDSDSPDETPPSTPPPATPPSTPTTPPPPPSVTPRQWLILSVLMIATLTSSFAVCLFPPFFPKIAEEKGCSAFVYGVIIGTNCLASFIVTPIIGKHQRTIGVRFALIAGMFMGGVCCLLSGFLEFFKPGPMFVGLAVLIRVVHATGNAFVITATFTFTAVEFSNSVGKIFSLTRTFMNLAQLFGPSIGGAIYGAGGFYLPFVVMGTVQIMMSFASIPLLPHCKVKKPRKSRRNDKKITVTNMLSIPKIWFSFLTFIVATACNGFLSINLEPQVLRRFELAPFYVGLVFGLKDGANSIASPIWGFLCDLNMKYSVKPYIIISSVVAGSSFFLLGADGVLGIHMNLTIPLVIAALVLNGVGIGGQQVAGIVDALHEAVNAGYPDDPNMHGLIAGLWSSLSGAGRFVSRAGSGIMVDHFGFEATAFVALSAQILVTAITLFYFVVFEIRFFRKQKSVHWDDLSVIEEASEEDDEIVFNESSSPSESVMSRSIQVEIPSSSRTSQSGVASSLTYSSRRSARSAHVARSLPASHRRYSLIRRDFPNDLFTSEEITRSFIGSCSMD